jgi:hypothetical protein
MALTSTPANRMEPRVGVVRPSSILPNVDLPEPDSPTMVGDFAYIPRGTVHRNQNMTDKPARTIELNIIDKDKPLLEPVTE